MATTYLESDFTGTGASGPAIATYSFWVKLELSDTRATLVSGKDNGDYLKVRFADDGSGHYLGLYGTSMDMKSTRVFRDPGAWYHVVMAFDTGQAAASDRIKVWINNEQITDWASDTRFGQNSDLYLTKADNVQIGAYDNTEHFDGIMAHVHCCDGTAYTPTDFAETDSTSGIWVPKTSPSVTYGTKGYFLKFASGAEGTDSSGNGNDFTVNGTMTTTKDTPNNNFCTLTPLYQKVGVTYNFSNGNTVLDTSGGSGWHQAMGTLAAGAGKWYYEAYANYSPGAYNTMVGWGSSDYLARSKADGEIGQSISKPSFGLYDVGTLKYSTDSSNGQQTASWAAAWVSGDYLMFAVDLDNGRFYVGKNGTWDTTSSSNPSAGTGGYSFTVGDFLYTPMMSIYYEDVILNFGNGYFGTTSAGATNADGDGYGVFKYTVPTGFKALCTDQLATYG